MKHEREMDGNGSGAGSGRAFARLAVAWGACVGLVYGAADLGRIMAAGQVPWTRITPHLLYIVLLLLGYAGVFGLALTIWTGLMAAALRTVHRRLDWERWRKAGFGPLVGLASGFMVLNLFDVCIQRDVFRETGRGREAYVLRDVYLLLWTFVFGGAVGWAAARSLARVERWRQALLGGLVTGRVPRACGLAVAIVAMALLGAALRKPVVSRYAAWQHKYSVLLITIDTLRTDYLSCYGSSNVRTANMDALASGGVLFANAISQAPWTRPSVATILTGLYPSIHDAGRMTQVGGHLQAPIHGIRQSVPMLAERLASAHLTTQAFVTNTHLRGRFGFRRGFHDFFHFDLGMGDRDRQRYKQQVERYKLHLGLARLVRLHPVLFLDYQPPMPRGRPPAATLRGSADDVVTFAADWLAKSGRQAPFFLWLHLLDPHEYVRYHAIPRESASAPTASPPASPSIPFTIRVIPKEEQDGFTPLEQQERIYRDNIAYTDWALGWLFDRMKSLGLYEKTLIILTSDHGEEFMEHGKTGHGHSLYDEMIRVPLILSLPGVLPAGKRVEKQARLVDIVPTVLDLLRVSPPSHLDGKSLRPLLTPGAEEGDREAFTEFILYGTEEQKSLRTGRFKVMYTFDTKRIKLYDLRADPQEQENVAGEMVAVTSRLLSRMNEWANETRRLASVVGRPGDTLVLSHDKEIVERLKALGYITE